MKKYLYILVVLVFTNCITWQNSFMISEYASIPTKEDIKCEIKSIEIFKSSKFYNDCYQINVSFIVINNSDYDLLNESTKAICGKPVDLIKLIPNNKKYNLIHYMRTIISGSVKQNISKKDESIVKNNIIIKKSTIKYDDLFGEYAVRFFFSREISKNHFVKEYCVSPIYEVKLK